MGRRCRIFAVLVGIAALTVACVPPTETPSAPMTSTTTSAAPDSGPSVVTPLLASVIAPPIPVPATDGKVHLAYELFLTNVLSQELTLTSLDVRASDTTLLSLAGDRLAYWMRVFGNHTPTTKLGPAQSAAVWLDVALDKGTPVPAELVHAIGVSLPDPQPPLFPATMTETVAPVTVQTRTPPVIAPPLVGTNWVDANSCCDMTPHRMALNPLNGQLWAAERFAIDYVQLLPDGRLFNGDKTKPESYPGFGADIHAVSDGQVVAVVDGLPEQVPGTNPSGLPLDQYAGNHIVQALGDGSYALYAHLKTGSIKVEVGERVSSGQVIASLGNSGNTDGPHLHFHVMSTPDPLRSNGLPFVLSSFKLDGRIASMDAEDSIEAGKPAPMQPNFSPRDESAVSPLVLDVMTYAGR
ncbi:peptidase M23-like protein [Mycolicibacterium moriokaense]|uniref:Peptidase M23-like protein n=1 Tax=Mycolicibacterium moriokaense TaxID=39691 RepID=A0A318HAM7_9MYCO|nr:peptidase M23-like protein [Mycolicibacterium moriokaense]